MGDAITKPVTLVIERIRPKMNAGWIYDGVVVTSDLRDVQIESGDALIYAGKPEHIVASAARSSEVGLRRSYLDLLAGVLDAAAPLVRSDYRATTDPVPEHLVIDDSLDPHRIPG